MVAEQHKIVSLIGNIAPDGSASYYDVIIRIADKVRAPHFPMPVPVIADTASDRELFTSLKPVRRVADACRQGRCHLRRHRPDVGHRAAVLRTASSRPRELADMQARGAAGEIAGMGL